MSDNIVSLLLSNAALRKQLDLFGDELQSMEVKMLQLRQDYVQLEQHLPAKR